MRKHLSPVAIGMALLFLAPGAAQRASAIEDAAKESSGAGQASLQRLAKASSRVIVGKVLSQESKWVGKKIVTVAKVDPLEVFKGEATPGRPLEVGYLGGTVGTTAMDYGHEPTLQTGEIVLLFLQEHDPKAIVPGLRIAQEDGRVRLIAPKEKETRLKNNRRLRAYLKQVAEAVK
ncbi:MAG TPA: hypothetical protein VNP98_10445 [Chthoniobacterales bacterium]|nr:hypothetical protein [Chthoniobacterales bacterium]